MSAAGLTAILLTVLPAASDSHGLPSFSAHAYSGESSVPIEVGSVIAEGIRDGDRCVFEEPFGVGAVVDDGSPSPKIVWHLNENCEAVISEIKTGDPIPNEAPADGSFQEPDDVTDVLEGSG